MLGDKLGLIKLYNSSKTIYANFYQSQRTQKNEGLTNILRKSSIKFLIPVLFSDILRYVYI
ncbi:MAG: hypothetical protein AN488_17575 [Anabaena sp. WA113]|uniref:Uncharacterized protein n=2 Tax=Aphanizomenon flos-aquae TaxID=1176 RepID=A0A1B7X0N7_APHFL|nr:MAG: hypothetical protein AN488_17575 [Anabaena sp. WA113]OBQ27148.1 MAG: hypothetical protein AN481_01505 [Aphanizomenon flos-aquae LD13]OBQ31130.1 MAG: hypothetical protein AN483_02030 [Aphanizomenon flos-aquae MDT14a]OBQ42951.1 MAG: hypothetical protein AN484_15085 [Aphanizomenon flos-aquae WA102]HCQ23087.1 hypothetical protein [Anabaena sp. UBA12330]